jgi:hypothetical protein
MDIVESNHLYSYFTPGRGYQGEANTKEHRNMRLPHFHVNNLKLADDVCGVAIWEVLDICKLLV